MGGLDLSFVSWDIISKFVLGGFMFSINLTLVATLGGIVFGTILALMRLSGSKPFALIATIYVNGMRSVPLVMVILWFFLLVPLITGRAVGAELSATITFIAFEQLLYYSLAKYRNTPIEYYIGRDEDFDPTYTGFARFEGVPYQTKFIHALGDFKKSSVTCQHLAKRLRKDYPEYYYRILKVCQESGLVLHNKAYQLPELSPITNDISYFLHLKTHFETFEVKNLQQ